MTDQTLFTTIRETLFTSVIGDILDVAGLTHQFLPPEIRALNPDHAIGGVVPEGDGLDPGEQVIVMPHTRCGHCTACRAGRTNACRSNQTLGVQQDGGLADQILLPPKQMIPNDTLALRHLALVAPLAVGLHAGARGQCGCRYRDGRMVER